MLASTPSPKRIFCACLLISDLCPRSCILGRNLRRLTGPETPAAMVFHECVGKTKLGIEWLATGNSFGVSNSGHDRGSVVHPYFHLVVLEDLIFRVVFPRFCKIVRARRDLSFGICQGVILHHTLFDAGGVTVLVAKGELAFHAQNVILVAGPKGNKGKDEQGQNEKNVFHDEEDFAAPSSRKSERGFVLALPDNR